MTVRFIPLPTEDETRRSQETTLDGRTFGIRYSWSEREDSWFFAMDDVDGNPLISGVKLVIGYDLIRTLATEARPGGEIHLLMTTNEDPTRETIDQAQLVYVPLEDL